jgi:hypothetical protein
VAATVAVSFVSVAGEVASSVAGDKGVGSVRVTDGRSHLTPAVGAVVALDDSIDTTGISVGKGTKKLKTIVFGF